MASRRPLRERIARAESDATIINWKPAPSSTAATTRLTSPSHGDPLVSFVDQMPLLVQLHVVSTFALMMVFPFTRAALLAAFAIRRTASLLTAPLSAAAAVARAWIDRHDPASWIWPEEDAWEDGAVQAHAVNDVSVDMARGPNSPATLPPLSGVRDSGVRGSRGSYSLEADAELDKTGSEVG